MAFDLQTFRTRALTAVVFVIIMLAGLLWNEWSFLILFMIIHWGCWREFLKLIRKIKPESYWQNIWLGILYISLPIALLLLMRMPFREIKESTLLKVLPCGIIFSIWINDTMAYIVGSLIGKHPISKISPKKTWEGTIGGIILCVVIISIAGKWSGFYTTTDWIAISLLCGVFGSIGDLIESKIKRMAKVKDSGNLMPGHGGFLDRFDSLLIATIAVYVWYYFFMR
ncbi:MAG: phosphatidate cytidylyltransferase [Bacteroidetes bacterium]|nr:phosphatidate cytidylyltransferase [Bacteroidota bacterium]